MHSLVLYKHNSAGKTGYELNMVLQTMDNMWIHVKQNEDDMAKVVIFLQNLMELVWCSNFVVKTCSHTFFYVC